MLKERSTRELVVHQRPAQRWRGRVAVASAALLIALVSVAAVSSVGAAAPAGSSTADGWEFIRGPGALTPTEVEYDGERALRLDYHFEDPYMTEPYDGKTVLAVRALPPDDRDWTELEAIRFALKSDDPAGLRTAAVQIQLLSAGGAIVQSPLITFDRSEWDEIELPLYRFSSLTNPDFRWDEVLQERIVIRYQGGPFEPQSVYFGGWQRIADTGIDLPDASETPTETITAALPNGAEVDFEVGASDQLLYGMAAARVAGTTLRSDDPAHLVSPVVRTVDGRTHRAFRFDGIEQVGGATVLRASALDSDVMLRWVFTPHQDEVRGEVFEGFGYHYELSSPTERFERIEEQATWELGGASVGNTAVLRGSSYATEVDGALDSEFDVRDYWHTRVRFAHGDAFDYQAGPDGQLYVTFDRADLLETTFVKHAGKDVFETKDVFFVPETSEVSTVQKQVLHATRGITDTTDVVNAQTAVRDSVYERLREQYDITVGPVRPQVAFYEKGEQEHLDRIIQNGWLEEAADLGFRVVNLGRLWDSDPENGGPSNVHGVTLWNFDIADEWGGNDALGRVIDAAHEEGLDTRLWAPSGQMSRNSPEVVPHPEWQVVNRYGALGGNYWSLAGMDMADPGARGLLRDGLAARRTGQGLDGLWLDSFHDLGLHIFDHGNEPARPHVEETLDHVRDLRALGFDVNVEATSPFGISSNLYTSDRFTDFYAGHEYRAYETVPHFAVAPKKLDFYRFAANKAMPYNSVAENPGYWSALQTNDELRDLVRQTNHDYNAVAEYMDVRRLLPEDRGVVWTPEIPRKDRLVLFSFDEFSFSVQGANASVLDVTTGEDVPLEGNEFTAQPQHSYLVTSRVAAELCAKLRTPCG